MEKTANTIFPIHQKTIFLNKGVLVPLLKCAVTALTTNYQTPLLNLLLNLSLSYGFLSLMYMSENYNIAVFVIVFSNLHLLHCYFNGSG